MPHSFAHQPVLMPELLEGLNISSSGIYIDATFGRGGHSRAILNCLASQGRLFTIDKDPAAIAYAKANFNNDNRFYIQQGSFTELYDLAVKHNCVGKVDGIVLDLGVSSPQLDDPERGFSFMRDGPLDMRMDPSQGINAAKWLATVKEEVLANVIYMYGEERYSRRIAKAIVQARQESPITTTKRLAEIVATAHPAWEQHKHPATRTFQALRIFINKELDELRTVLTQCLTVLKVGGRLGVISFHSLEDRIVKQFIQQQAKGDSFLSQLPIIDQQLNMRARSIGKAIKPSAAEKQRNPRSRSAVLRIMEKIK